jgi:hypothetical protein
MRPPSAISLQTFLNCLHLSLKTKYDVTKRDTAIMLVCIRQSQRVPKCSMKMYLVDTFERRNGLALVLVQSVADDTTILDVDFGGFTIVLPGESVLHPVLVVTLQGL